MSPAKPPRFPQLTLEQLTPEQRTLADEIMSILMGEDVESRKHFIQTNARDVDFVDI